MILRDRDVVDVDVLLADEVEQQVERAVVHRADADGERRFVRAFVRVDVRSRGLVSAFAALAGFSDMT